MRASSRLIATMIAFGTALAGSVTLVAGQVADQAEPVPVNLNCDAISYRGALDPTTAKELEPIHDLDKVGTILTQHGVVFDRSRGVLTIALPPKAKAEIDHLPPGEPIILPSKDGGVVCVLVPSADSV